MTQAELDALPDASPSFGIEEVELPDGSIQRRAFMVSPPVGALWTSDDEPSSVVDVHGQRWMVGWANGVRYKRRVI